uniref:Uncharacterized protein n=1 Tax=Solanum tuberosum TaxID=4113 RepID=M1DLU2_SOLTU
MPNSDSSLNIPISQEVENPSSFNFSFPTPEESPSTPVCGNSKAQSMAKPSAEPLYEEMEVSSMAVLSTMSERLFEWDLPKGKGSKSCILVTGPELVAVQSLPSLRGDS